MGELSETFWKILGNFLSILVTGPSNRITPERLKEKRPSVGNDYVSELNTPTSLKIRKPSGSPERSSQTKPKSLASGSKGKPKSLFDGPSEGPPHKQSQRGSKKFSIFKFLLSLINVEFYSKVLRYANLSSKSEFH